MENLEAERRRLNKQQTELRELLTSSNRFDQALDLLYIQHSSLHSKKLDPTDSQDTKIWSYEDAILDDMSESQFRKLPNNGKHSIAWLIWHLARIEDIAMNILVANSDQIFNQGDWYQDLNTKFRHTGNSMQPDEIILLSKKIDLDALRAYRVAVGQSTRKIFKNLSIIRLKEKVNPDRIQRIKYEGAVTEPAYGIADYWSRRNIAGLLLMPATRHNLVHLNEATRVKNRLA